MIKILHVIKSLGRGGAEMLLPEMLSVHNQEKFEFHYIYFLPWKDQMVPEIETNGGRVSCFSANNNIQLITKYRKVKEYIKSNNIDLIHAHLPWAGFLVRFVHRNTSVPVIYTEHNKQERYHKITFLLNKLTFSWQNCVVTVSKDVENSILKNIGNSNTDVQTILNGVNTAKFVRNESNGKKLREENAIPINAKVVGTVAVFRFQKRLIEWLQVFKEASDNNPDLYGVIVGDGPLKEELLAERKRLNLENKVLMPGLQINTIDWFSAMDIFMMSSIFEGLPIALLEAMSTKCAILTTDAGGIKEVIRNNKNGVLVNVDDWRSLSNELQLLLHDPEKLKLIGENAREHVKTHFSLHHMVKSIEALYLEIIDIKQTK